MKHVKRQAPALWGLMVFIDGSPMLQSARKSCCRVVWALMVHGVVAEKCCKRSNYISGRLADSDSRVADHVEEE